MRRTITIMTILLLASQTGNAKLVMIDIKKMLQDVTIIKTIIVVGYTDSTMLYKFENSKYALSINCKTKKDSEAFRLALIERKIVKVSDLAGKWPNVGQKVLRASLISQFFDSTFSIG